MAESGGSSNGGNGGGGAQRGSMWVKDASAERETLSGMLGGSNRGVKPGSSIAVQMFEKIMMRELRSAQGLIDLSKQERENEPERYEAACRAPDGPKVDQAQAKITWVLDQLCLRSPASEPPKQAKDLVEANLPSCCGGGRPAAGGASGAGCIGTGTRM